MGTILLRASASRIGDWVARNAVRLAQPFDGGTADIENLACLDLEIAKADIVLLGELNHFIHEKSDFRLFFCRYLLSRGFCNFAEELGWSDGKRVERYLGGADDELQRLPSFGYTGHKRQDRDDRPTGLLRPVFDSYPAELFMAEQTRFYRGLRDSASGRPLRYFGFDVDGSPGGAYEDIEFALRHCADSSADALIAALARVPGETALEEADRLQRTRDALATLSQKLSDRTIADVRVSLSALIDSLRYVDKTYTAQTYDALRPGMEFREDAMKRRVAEIEALCVPERRIAIMGHALHLVKDDHQVVALGDGVGPGGGRTPSLGHHLAREREKRIVAIWFAYGCGEDSQPFGKLPRKAEFSRNSFNVILSQFGTPLFLRTDDPVFDEIVRVGHMYNALVELSLSKQADAVFFLPRVTPLARA